MSVCVHAAFGGVSSTKALKQETESSTISETSQKKIFLKKPNTYPVSATNTSLKHYHRELAKMKLSLVIIVI